MESFPDLYLNVLSGVIVLLVFGTIYTLVYPMLQGDVLKKRMESVASTRTDLRNQRMNQLQKATGLREGNNKNFISRIVENLSLEKQLEASNLRDKLAQAGYRGQRPVYLFYFFRLALPIGFGVVGLLFLLGLNIMGWQLQQNLMAILALVALGYYLPVLFIRSKAKKRESSVAEVFPDALDLLLICVESGMSVEVAFSRVAKEMAENSVELAEEFSLTTAELSYLQTRRQAYENLARRNNNPGVRSVSTALIQAERYGTPLGDTLRTLAQENRQMRMMAAEKKAAALPAKLTVPMILFFLPVLFIVILTPAVMRMASAFAS